MLMWLPPQTEAAIGVSRACLQQRRDAPLSHDNLFHTVMGLMDVGSAVLKPALDLTAPCRSLRVPAPLRSEAIPLAQR
jgi:lipid A ethanolaminephosphotransferase